MHKQSQKEYCNYCNDYIWNGENKLQGNLGFRCDAGAFRENHSEMKEIPDNCPKRKKD